MLRRSTIVHNYIAESREARSSCKETVAKGAGKETGTILCRHAFMWICTWCMPLHGRLAYTRKTRPLTGGDSSHYTNGDRCLTTNVDFQIQFHQTVTNMHMYTNLFCTPTCFPTYVQTDPLTHLPRIRLEALLSTSQSVCMYV